MQDFDYDVAIVGYGPVGQALAGLLGQQGVRVGVFERWPHLYPLPRACVVDHEIMRTLQKLGVAEEFSQLAVATAGEYLWLNAEGRTLYHFRYKREGISGWPARSLMYQPDLEAVLDARVRQLATVQVHQGWEAIACHQMNGHVELGVAQVRQDEQSGLVRSGQERRVTARFLVGADGANSFVRRAAGLPWTDLGFRADWLVVDFRPHDPERELDMPEAAQLCDPARPTTLMRRMGRRHVRWEMMLLPGETVAEMTQPEKVWELIARWVQPRDGVIDRAAVYTFRSGVAPSWQAGSVLLAGDAAHLMPPFLGQGLCSGVRDSLALAWRLDLMLRGVADQRLLHSYQEERKAHVRTVIDRAVALGKVVCITDPAQARERDAAILAGSAPAVPEFPALTTGLLQRDAAGALALSAGRLALQGRVALGNRTARLDDIAGSGWQVIACDAHFFEALTPSEQDFALAIGMHFVAFGANALQDIDGAYGEWLTQLDTRCVIVRPDFYIFATANSPSDLRAALADLRHQLCPARDLAPAH
jgi:2-polyprenyl-6-methoxyphenol hydroxylase-like FAD-dependent oxidoreductase